MIVEESRLQALSSLYATTKDLFLQTNSHRLWCMALLVGSLILLGVFFFQTEGLVRLMIGLAVALVSFTLLVSELFLSRRLYLTRSVLVRIERELSGHITEYLGRKAARNNHSKKIISTEGENPRSSGNEDGNEMLWPVSLMSTGSKSSSLVAADSSNWIIFIHGLAGFGIMVTLGVEIIHSVEVGLFSSILTLSYLVGVLAFSAFFVYVVASERHLQEIVLGKSENEARDQSKRMVWQALGAVLVVMGPFLCYAGMNSKTGNMIEEVWQALGSVGTETTFWAPVLLAAGLFMIFISLIWRSVESGTLEAKTESQPEPE